MLRRTHPRFFSLTGALLLAAITLPYLWAGRVAGQAYVFSGFLVNPLDGASYLAKMQQGFQGAWRYRLAFTAQPGQGAYLFLFYLLLGHVARWTGASLLLVYHLARVLGSLALLCSLDAFLGALLPPRGHKIAFLLAVFGSGMGWLAAPWAFTADFWVAEAYPFLSAYVNPHFPLSLALMLWLLQPARRSWLAACGAAFSLALLSPFGMVLVLLLRAALALPDAFSSRSGLWRTSFSLAPLVLGGLPYLLYTQWVVRSDALLASWNAQNLTPAPPWWDVLLSFSPLLLLAVWGILRRKAMPPALLVLWLALALGVLYLPINLQRRFLTGLYVPVAGLAGWTMASWPTVRLRLGVPLLLALCLPVNLFLLLLPASFSAAPPPELYLRADEAQSLRWLAEHTPREAVVLASPQLGAFIPALSGRRVVYGHPFETPHAGAARQAVQRFFAGQFLPEDLPYLSPARYVLIGPRERRLGIHPPAAPPLYRTGQVGIWPASLWLP